MSGHQNVSDSDDDDRSVTSVLTRSDAGLYTCVVKNIAGHVAHNVSLFIEGQTQSPFFFRAMHAQARPMPSCGVSLSDTFVYCVETAKDTTVVAVNANR